MSRDTTEDASNEENYEEENVTFTLWKTFLIETQIQSAANQGPKNSFDRPIKEYAFFEEPKKDQRKCFTEEIHSGFVSKRFTREERQAIHSISTNSNPIDNNNGFNCTDWKTEETFTQNYHH